MAVLISICNQKGGVGKTTTAVNLSASLAVLGKPTLLVDLDPQGSATISSGADRARLIRTVYDVLVDGVPPEEAAVKTPVEQLDLLPANLELSRAEIRLAQMPDPESALKKAVATLRERYQTIVFDCPPSLGIITSNALVASDYVIIPVQCEYLALEGLNALVKAIERVKNGRNASLEIGGIVLTMTDFRSNLSREVVEEISRFFNDLVFKSSIPRNIRLAESPSFGKPACVYDKHSTGAIAYHLLAKEVISRLFGKNSSELTAAQSGVSGEVAQPINERQEG